MNGIITIKNTTIYKCVYCGKMYTRAFYAKEHYLRCRKHPDNIGLCHTCDYIENKEFSVQCFSQSSDEYKEKKKSLYCSKKEIFLKPRWSNTVIDGYFCELPEVDKMPLECNYFLTKTLSL